MWLQPSKDFVAFFNLELSLHKMHWRYQEIRSCRESSVMKPQVRKQAPSNILQRHTKASWALQTNLTLTCGNFKNSIQISIFQIPHDHNGSLNMRTLFIYLQGENAPPWDHWDDLWMWCVESSFRFVLWTSMKAPPVLEWCQGQPQLRSSGALQK